MKKETELGFYTYKSLTIAIVSNERLPCNFHERYRHMVNNHSGMYTLHEPDYFHFLNNMVLDCDPKGPYALTQRRVESGRFVFISQDLLLGMSPDTREMLYDQIETSYKIAGNETQELHNWYFTDSVQDSVDRAIIRSTSGTTFENYLYSLIKAQVKSAHPGIGFFKRIQTESRYRNRHEIARRFKTAETVRKEAKRK